MEVRGRERNVENIIRKVISKNIFKPMKYVITGQRNMGPKEDICKENHM